MSSGWDPMKSLGRRQILNKRHFIYEKFWLLLLPLVFSMSLHSPVCPIFSCHLSNGTVKVPCCYSLSVFAFYVKSSCIGSSSDLCCRSLGGVFDNMVNTTITSKHDNFVQEMKRNEREEGGTWKTI